MNPTILPPNGMEASKALDEERKIMAAYSDTAKTYSQLSLGALVLSVTFIEKVVNTDVSEATTPWLFAAWSCWLLSAVSGAFYQYLAVRFLEARGEDWKVLVRGGHVQAFEWLARHPWPAYALMLISFGAGSLLFVIFGTFVLLKVRCIV
jgi:hypothetical protein